MEHQQLKISTGSVKTEGDEIYFEIRGKGEPLLLIPGGGGDAGYYSYVANILADQYQVITYDRRGNSRSTRNGALNFELGQQARDAVAVLHASGNSSAYVFGNSSGAVIALEMAKSQPQAIKAVIAHEPPTVRVLPDSKKWLNFFATIYKTFLRFGEPIASLKFNLSLGIPLRTFRFVPKDFAERMKKAENIYFWLDREMITSINYEPDVERIKYNKIKMFMAAGQMTLNKKKYYGRTAPILADMLGCEMIIFPGHHLSYFDQPEEWAATLDTILQNTNN